ncbi:MAG TPA: CBS domain-containing protein [Bacteroidota bacterium]
MTIVREILETKGKDIWSISPSATVFEALKLMAEKNVGALVVSDKEKVAGIISERDYARKIILHGKSSKEALVKDIMSSNVVFVRPDQSVEECMVLMSDKRIRHLPVLENERLIGVISIGDVVKAIIAQHKYHIEQLENYIKGGR